MNYWDYRIEVNEEMGLRRRSYEEEEQSVLSEEENLHLTLREDPILRTHDGSHPLRTFLAPLLAFYPRRSLSLVFPAFQIWRKFSVKSALTIRTKECTYGNGKYTEQPDDALAVPLFIYTLSPP